MAKKMLPDQAYLRECFCYNQATGVLTWRKRPRRHFQTDHEFQRWNSRYAQTRAGSNSGRYRHIRLDRQGFNEHRVIFKLVTGYDPPDEIDHKNNNGHDNRWKNLRACTHAQNIHKSPRRKNARLPKGVSRHKFGYQAGIRIGGKTISIGLFKTPEEAHAAYCERAREVFGEFFDAGH